jgi:transketolase
MADLVAVLYGRVLNLRPQEPDWPERDRFILSKGHCCTGVYAALALRGFIPLEELNTYGRPDSRLMSHIRHAVPGVEWSTGSLGHGLGLACGQALAALRRGQTWRVYTLLSDGELNEGSNWEAIMFAGHHRLKNVTAIVDANGIQSLGATREVLDLGDLAEKFRVFGWEARTIDGHDLEAIVQSLEPSPGDRPRCVIARTVKGRGVKFMENRLEWHYRAPKTEALLQQALSELEQSSGVS